MCFGLKEEEPQGSVLDKVEEKYVDTDHRPILIKTEQTSSNTEERIHEPKEEKLHSEIHEKPEDIDTEELESKEAENIIDDLNDNTTSFMENENFDILGQKNVILKRRTKSYPEMCRIDGNTIYKKHLKKFLKKYYYHGQDNLYHCNCYIKTSQKRGHRESSSTS